MPDFADIVSQGILTGFAGISPYLEKEQRMAMLREDRDYARLVSEEDRGYKASQAQREQDMFNLNVLSTKQSMKFEGQMQPKRLEQADAAIEASKTQTDLTKLNMTVTQEELDRQRKYLADRKMVVDKMRGTIGDDKDLNITLDSFATDMNLSTAQIHEMMEQKVREKAAPAMIAMIKSGKMESIDPAAATLLEMQYVTNGKVDLSTIAPYIYPKSTIQRSFAMDLLKTAAEIKMQMNPDDPLMGAADMINMLASFDGSWQMMGDLSPSLITGEDNPLAKQRAQEDAAVPSSEDVALMSPGEAIQKGVKLGDLLRTGSRGQELGGYKWDRRKIDTFSALQSLPDSVRTIAARQPEPFQLVTGDVLTGKPLGAFSAGLAALSPGVGEGEPEDRIAGFITSDKGGVQGEDRTKIAQRAMQMVGLIEKPNDTYSRQAILQKASDLYFKLRQSGDLGVSGKEESILKILIEWLKGPPGDMVGTQAGRGGDTLSKGRGIGPEPQP